MGCHVRREAHCLLMVTLMSDKMIGNPSAGRVDAVLQFKIPALYSERQSRNRIVKICKIGYNFLPEFYVGVKLCL